MSTDLGVDIASFAGTDPVWTIAEEVFAAMIDGEPGYLRPWDGEPPALAEPMHAWVDVAAPFAGRVLISAERTTAEQITRALLAMPEDEVVQDADYVDALGEVANVVGGNVKALVPDAGALSLPQVSTDAPLEGTGDLLHALPLDWRGNLLEIRLWTLP